MRKDFSCGWYRPVGWNWIYGYRIGAGNTVNGFYAANITGNYTDAASVGDYNSLNNARDLNDLFKVGV